MKEIYNSKAKLKNQNLRAILIPGVQDSHDFKIFKNCEFQKKLNSKE